MPVCFNFFLPGLNGLDRGVHEPRQQTNRLSLPTGAMRKQSGVCFTPSEQQLTTVELAGLPASSNAATRDATERPTERPTETSPFEKRFFDFLLALS